MNNPNSYDFKLSQARGLASQLGMFAEENDIPKDLWDSFCLLYTSPSPRDGLLSRMPSSA